MVQILQFPLKRKNYPFIDKLSDEAKEANSVNTIYLSGNKVMWT